MSANTDKTTTSGRRRGPGKPFAKGQGVDPRINRKGRPKDGESWAAVFKAYGEMTPAEIADIVGGKSTDLGRAFLQMPKDLPMKHLMTLRVFTATMFEPNNGLLNTLIERVEGKVKEEVEHSGGVQLEGFERLLKAVYGRNNNTPKSKDA